MIPFRSRQEMLIAHEQMFGEAGRQAAEIVLRRASTLFAAPLDALNIRVVLAPVELDHITGISATAPAVKVRPRLFSATATWSSWAKAR